MKDLVEYIIKNIVNNPDDISVEESSDNGNIDLKLKVNPQDMGLVIGKGGQIIKSLRRLLTVRAISEGVRVNLELIEPEDTNTPQV